MDIEGQGRVKNDCKDLNLDKLENHSPMNTVRSLVQDRSKFGVKIHLTNEVTIHTHQALLQAMSTQQRNKTYKSSCPYRAYILMEEDERWIKQASVMKARGPMKKYKAESQN